LSDNVISIGGDRVIGEGITVSPDAVLTGAVAKLDSVVVVGVDKDGAIYVASSEGQPEAVATLDLAKRWMLDQIAALRGWD
jgi:hypothetical protein